MPKKSRRSSSRVNSGDAQLAKIIRLLDSIDNNLAFIAENLPTKEHGGDFFGQPGIMEQIAPMIIGAMQGMSPQPSQQAPQMPQLPQLPQAPNAGGQGVVLPRLNDNPFVIPPMPNDNPFTEP